MYNKNVIVVKHGLKIDSMSIKLCLFQPVLIRKKICKVSFQSKLATVSPALRLFRDFLPHVKRGGLIVALCIGFKFTDVAISKVVGCASTVILISY